LPAAARAARHRLLAGAARAGGAQVILLGHTANDLAEAAAMRAEGATTPDPRVWSPSPVWPEGRGVFLLRPLLQAGRAELRAWLRGRDEAWIEDPANSDPRYARSRARLTRPAAPPPTPTEAPLALAGLALEHAGVIAVDRSRLRAEPLEAVHRFVGVAAVCAGGGERLPPSSRVARVAAALVGSEPFVGTLAGARIEVRNGSVRIHRESGEAGRGGLASMRPPGVWDGRFEIASGPEVRRLAGLAGRLTPADRAILRDIPAAARGALPAVVEADGGVRLAPLHSLVGARFRAAAGLVQREPA
jgi:tRNA(Ile)-lysidine synthase